MCHGGAFACVGRLNLIDRKAGCFTVNAGLRWAGVKSFWSPLGRRV